jgi:hypothetical protein
MRTEVQEFLRSTFRSVWSLEMLLFLKRQPNSAWTRQELVSELRSSDFVVAQSLDALIAGGLILVEDEERVRYRPATPEIERLTDEVEEVYRRKPDAVRRLIVFSPAGELQLFSDAFKLRKD